MLESFQSSSESHVALFSPQEVRQQVLPPSEREFQVFDEVTPGGQFGSAGASPSQASPFQASPFQVPPNGRDLPIAPVKQRTRRAWAPDADDHLIYRWVKLDGKGQDFVAQCFGIHQSTVSRIVQRYERWQAHAEARDDGRLDPAERLRNQRWLAFERNEAMLTSCLRLAGEMEGCKDVSKSVTRHPQSSPTQETDVRTEWSVLDRTGMAARFLRLAFRINMEQVKLAEAEPAPLPEPLTEEEVAQQEAQAAEERAQIMAVREQSKQKVQASRVSIMDQLQAARCEAAEARRDAAAAWEEAEEARRDAEEARSRTSAQSRPQAPSGASGGEDADLRSDSRLAGEVDCDAAPSRREGAPLLNLHNLHTPSDAESGASAEPAGFYAAKASAEKIYGGCMHPSPALVLEELSLPSEIARTTGKKPGEPPRAAP